MMTVIRMRKIKWV